MITSNREYPILYITKNKTYLADRQGKWVWSGDTVRSAFEKAGGRDARSELTVVLGHEFTYIWLVKRPFAVDDHKALSEVRETVPEEVVSYSMAYKQVKDSDGVNYWVQYAACGAGLVEQLYALAGEFRIKVKAVLPVEFLIAFGVGNKITKKGHEILVSEGPEEIGVWYKSGWVYKCASGSTAIKAMLKKAQEEKNLQIKLICEKVNLLKAIEQIKSKILNKKQILGFGWYDSLDKKPVGWDIDIKMFLAGVFATMACIGFLWVGGKTYQQFKKGMVNRAVLPTTVTSVTVRPTAIPRKQLTTVVVYISRPGISEDLIIKELTQIPNFEVKSQIVGDTEEQLNFNVAIKEGLDIGVWQKVEKVLTQNKIKIVLSSEYLSEDNLVDIQIKL